MLSQYILGFMAGGLSLLAPCVLPILPLIVASSLKTSKWGPLLSALGLTLSFTIFGILTTTFASIFDPDIIRNIGAVILILVGLFFVIPSLKNISAGAFQKLSELGNRLQGKVSQGNPLAEFLGGSLLGLIWSPCTGPTLAIAIGLASQAKSVAHASLVFFFFGLGAGLGLVSLGLLIRKFTFLRKNLLRFGGVVNMLVGGLSIAIGVLILTGLEAEAQEYLLKVIPEWLTKLTVTI